MPVMNWAVSEAAAFWAARFHASMNDWAVTVSPLLNWVPERSLNVHVVHGSSRVQLSATPGLICAVALSRVTRPSKMALVTFWPSDSWELYGSMAVGSTMPRRKTPPCLPVPPPVLFWAAGVFLSLDPQADASSA